METLLVPLTQLTVDPRIQPRVAGVVADHVQELAEGTEWWPPVRTVKRNNQLFVVDGFHRFFAAKNLGLDKIAIAVMDVPENEDLRALAFALNATHGLPFSLEDRRTHAAHLLRVHPDGSDRDIGRQCGLAAATVRKIRSELVHDNAIPITDTRIGRDGRTYSAPQRALASGPTVQTTLGEMIGDLLSPAEQRAQRQLVRYLEQLADFLEQQEGTPSFETFDQAAQACKAILGPERAKELGEHLGWSASNIFQIALALGYREDDQP